MIIQEDKKGISLEFPKDKDNIVEILEVIDKNFIERISINNAFINDPLIDLKFLHGIKDKKSIKGISFGKCFNLDVLYEFSNLQRINADSVNDEIVDLAYFPKLIYLMYAHWKKSTVFLPYLYYKVLN